MRSSSSEAVARNPFAMGPGRGVHVINSGNLPLSSPLHPRLPRSPRRPTALQMARTESATLVPVRLERIPLHLPMDASPDHQLADALAGIQRRARDLGVHIDPRIGHGRSYRHALLRTLTTERYDRVVLATGPGSGVEFTAADVAWVVDHADAEIVVMAAERPRRPRRNALSYAP
jgi:hypothetical protein